MARPTKCKFCYAPARDHRQIETTGYCDHICEEGEAKFRAHLDEMGRIVHSAAQRITDEVIARYRAELTTLEDVQEGVYDMIHEVLYEHFR